MIRPAAAPSGGPPLARQLAGAFLVYLMLALGLTANVWQDPVNRWIGICCDQEQSMWYLSWIPSAIGSGLNPLLTDRLNAPIGANLMWNTPSPLTAIAVAPITATWGPILAYNVTVLLTMALSGLVCFAALRRYTRRPLAPLVGGALYTLSPFIASHAVLHLILLNAWGPPAFLILFDELVVRRRRSPEVIGLVVGILGAIQLLTVEEVLATSAVFALVLALVLAAVVRDAPRIRDAGRRMVRAAIPAAGAFILLAGFPLGVQFLGPLQFHGSVTDASLYSTDLLNLVLPTPYQLIAPTAATALSSHFSGLFHEATAYVGVPLLAALAWIVAVRRREPAVLVAGAVAVVAFVLSLGPVLHVTADSTGIPMPWSPIGSLPLLEHVVPGRMTLYMWLAVAALTAFAIDHVLAMRPRRMVGGLGLIGLALVFVLPAPLPSTKVAVPDFFHSWGEQGIGSEDTILFAPWFTDGAGADPMLWAAVAGAKPRMVEGYLFVPDHLDRPRYGPEPGRLASLMIGIQDTGAATVARGDDRTAAVADLAKDRVADVIVGPMPHRAEMVAFFTDLLGAPPLETGGVELWRDVPSLLAQTSRATQGHSAV